MGIIDLPTKTGVLKVMRVAGPAKNKPLLWVPGKGVTRFKNGQNLFVNSFCRARKVSLGYCSRKVPKIDSYAKIVTCT